jgi:hypothetical protein
MKKLLITLIILISLPCYAVTGAGIKASGISTGTSGGGGGSSLYMGYCGENNTSCTSGLVTPNPVGTGQGPDTLTMIYNHNWTFTCPGTGNKTVTALSIRAYSAGGTPGTVDMAVYNSTGTTALCYGTTASVTTTNTNGAWYSTSSVSGSGCTLTGGTNYIIAFTSNTGDTMTMADNGQSGDWWADVEDWPESPHFWTTDLTDEKWTWYTTETSRWHVGATLQ